MPKKPLQERERLMKAYFRQQARQDLLRFITCGSVDDGKSTLIGRMLWESSQIHDDELRSLANDSKRYGTLGEDIDFALLVDGLSAEREQGITIDVAYRYFSSGRRKFIVADTPGHEQYTRNMITGASTADLAILLVDARKGLLTQTRRHANLVSLMGIRHVVLAVNKMDLLDFNTSTFHAIEAAFLEFSAPLKFNSITAIPLSALAGDNITQRSARTPWFSGPTLMEFLESFQPDSPLTRPFAFPVQWVNRPNSNFRGLSGTVAQGKVKVGDEIVVCQTGQAALVAEIVTMDGPLPVAKTDDAITLRLSKEIDASRGDVLCLKQEPLETTDQFQATLVWLNEEVGLIGRSYDLKLATQWASASVTSIKHRVNVDTQAKEASKTLSLNDISVCNLALSKGLVFDRFENSKAFGSFILVDKISRATLAAGMIQHSLRRSQNVHRQILSITRTEREKLNGHLGRVIWFTGLSGSGKSTIANALEVELHQQGMRTYILDGDNVRQGLNKDLGFSDADRVENIRRIAEVSKLMLDAGLIVLTAFISPFRREREMAKALIGEDRFIEVYVDTSLEVCEQRDVKGLYKKARSGLIPNMTGLTSPYEVPKSPALTVQGDQGTAAQTAKQILKEIGLMSGMGLSKN
jgi:bifunctional enzyme CysN/CysC